MGAAVRVRLYATARDALGGRPRIDREVPPTGIDLAAFVAALAADHPRLAPVLAASRLVVNGRFVGARARRLRPGDEVAIHPPYSGG